jgi:Tfp pilus tip-associated adhesin PilY1
VKDGSGAAWAAFFTSGYAANDAQQAGKQAYLYALDAYTGQAIWAGGANKIGLGFTGNYKTDYVNYTSSADHVQPERVLSTGGTVVLHRNWDWWQGDNSAHSCTFSIDRAVSDAANRSGTLYFKADSLKSPKSPNPDCWEPDFPTTYMSVLDKVPYASLAQAGWFAKPVPTALANNALNSPLAVDMDGDNMAEVLYTGDLYGNLYRVTNIGKGETPVSSLLFRFDPVPANPGPYAIRGKATVARSSVKDTVWVYFGTGRYETWDDKSAPGTNPQFFFGLKETKIPANGTPPAPYVHAYGGGTSTRQPVLRACQTQVTAHGQKLRLVTGDPNNDDSWGLRLGFGDGNERTFTKPLVVGGIVFFTTFVPDRNSCGGGGESFVFALDYATGLPTTFAVFDLDGDGKFTDADKVEVTQADGSKVKVAPAGISIGRGVGSAPVLFKNTLYVTTTAPIIGDIEAGGGNIGGLHALDVNIPQNRVSLESWKHN